MVEYVEFKDCFWGQNGFEELKKYMRLGNEFCKDLASILTERAEHELNYYKGLNKTSLRLQKLSKEFQGGLSDAWLQVSFQFDIEAEMHKSLASALQEEIVKPLKILTENQNKCRKPVEARVEKTIKNLTDKKTEDYKYRSRCFQLVKDIEKSMYSLDEAQKGIAGKPPNNKEIQKIESQIVKTKEQLEKSESKYHKACSSVELARQDWQLEMIKGCVQMQTIETDRICSLEQLIKKLSIQINLLSKKMLKIVDVYDNIKVDVKNDIKQACKKYGTCPNEQEIYLYDLYAENTKNMMNKDRRIGNLTKWAELFNTDVQSQIKSKQGLEKVKIFAKENPNFNANNDADVEIKLESVQLLQTLYESSLFKVQNALSDLLDSPKPSFNLTKQMYTTYDKQGVPITILKLSAPKFSITYNNDSTSHKATAPSPPISPLTHSSSFSQGNLNNSSNLITPMQMPMPIRMPISYNLLNQLENTSNIINNYNSGGESTSSSSTISSVSPSQYSQTSPLASLSANSYYTSNSCSSNSLSTNSNNNLKSSYLLTTASNNNNNINNNNNNNNSVPFDRPPSYIAATTLKRNNTNNESLCLNNNNINNTITTNNKNQVLLENHYNNSNQSLSDEDDDDDDWEESEYKFIGKCIAQYDFKATRNDEISINLGDEINIIEKRDDGWWKGKSNNMVGLFPSTYVKEDF